MAKKNNEQYRDYEITFILNEVEQRWIGESRALLHTHPKSRIINIKKIKRK